MFSLTFSWFSILFLCFINCFFFLILFFRPNSPLLFSSPDFSLFSFSSYSFSFYIFSIVFSSFSLFSSSQFLFLPYSPCLFLLIPRFLTYFLFPLIRSHSLTPFLSLPSSVHSFTVAPFPAPSPSLISFSLYSALVLSLPVVASSLVQQSSSSLLENINVMDSFRWLCTDGRAN